MFYVVYFHADGGQACMLGWRTLTNRESAESLRDHLLDEPGHNCKKSAFIDYIEEGEMELKVLHHGHFDIHDNSPRGGSSRYLDWLSAFCFEHNIPFYA